MLSYVRCIYFSDEPNYEYLIEKLYQIGKRYNLDLSKKDYDWLKKEPEEEMKK